MIEDRSGNVDYLEHGAGPTVVLIPGSCSTGAAWRPVIAALHGFRCVTTSLLGYGGTAERRTSEDPSIMHEADAIEAVIQKAGSPVHLVGHSFGGLVALAVALRGRASLSSLTILEAPAAEILREQNDGRYQDFRDMTDKYFAAFQAGDKEAVGKMIDFYGGRDTFLSWPPRVRAYAVETTPVNILDWASAYNFPLSAAVLAKIRIPTLVVWGSKSQPAVQRANAMLGECISQAASAVIEDAAHFMIATHPHEVAACISKQAALGSGWPEIIDRPVPTNKNFDCLAGGLANR